MGHSEREHSILSPSSSHRWLTCTPSAKLEAQFPNSTSEAAAEGTLAHELAEAKLRNYFYTADYTKQKLSRFITKCKKNSLWDNEMLEHTDAYLEYIKMAALSYESAPYVVPEKSYDLTMYIPETNAHGTADCVMIHGDQLLVFDFKYGKGVKVSAINNPQMMLYALGAYEVYKMFYAIKTVQLHIIQPRIDNYSDFELSLDDLLAFGEKVKQKSVLAMKGEGDFCPEVDACRFCRAKAQCRARADKNIQLAFATEKKPDLLSNEELAEYIKKGEDIAKWVEDIKAHALSQCLAGIEVPGYKAVEGRGSRDWTDMDKAFDVLKDKGFEEEVLYERKALTLAKLEKLVGKKDFNEYVGELIVKKQGEPALVEESDKRPAITNVVSAQEAFKEG